MQIVTPITMESDLSGEFPSTSQCESLFEELKQEDIIIPLTYVTLKTQVQDSKDGESGTYSETTTICALGGYNIQVKTEENTHSVILNECQANQNVMCNSFDIQVMSTTVDNEDFGMSYEEEPVFVTLTTVKTEPEGCVEEDDDYNDTKTICSLGGYEIDNKSENSHHLLEDGSQMNLDMSKEENDVYDIVPSIGASEREIFNIEYEEESGFTNLGSAKNEPLEYMEDEESSYYNGYENDVKNDTKNGTKEDLKNDDMRNDIKNDSHMLGIIDDVPQVTELRVNESIIASPEDFSVNQDGTRRYKGRKTHTCPVCKATYTRRLALEKHLPIHFGYRPYGCYMCKIYFKDRSVRDVHVQEHFANQPYFCHMCMKPFSLMTHFKKHVHMRKGGKSFSCGFCGRSFVDRSALDEHFQSHIARRPHHCEICKKSFRMKWQFDKHQTKHVGEKPKHNCNICEKSFFEKTSLEAHLEEHAEAPPVECDVCKKTFKDTKQLEEHAHTHKRNGSYFCEVCKKKYSMKARFYKHRCIQREKRFFGCGYCDKTFKWKSLLESHLSTHQIEVRYSCEVCKKGFSAKTSRDMHRRTHKNTYSCRICGKLFNEKLARDRHLRRHTLQERRSKMLLET